METPACWRRCRSACMRATLSPAAASLLEGSSSRTREKAAHEQGMNDPAPVAAVDLYLTYTFRKPGHGHGHGTSGGEGSSDGEGGGGGGGGGGDSGGEGSTRASSSCPVVPAVVGDDYGSRMAARSLASAAGAWIAAHAAAAAAEAAAEATEDALVASHAVLPRALAWHPMPLLQLSLGAMGS